MGRNCTRAPSLHRRLVPTWSILHRGDLGVCFAIGRGGGTPTHTISPTGHPYAHMVRRNQGDSGVSSVVRKSGTPPTRTIHPLGATMWEQLHTCTFPTRGILICTQLRHGSRALRCTLRHGGSGGLHPVAPSPQRGARVPTWYAPDQGDPGGTATTSKAPHKMLLSPQGPPTTQGIRVHPLLGAWRAAATPTCTITPPGSPIPTQFL